MPATKPDLNELAGKIQNDKSFSVLDGYITERTMKGIGEMGLTMMTDIQAKCIPDILKGQLVDAEYLVYFILEYYIENTYCSVA